MSQTNKILLGIGLVALTAGVAYAAVTHNPWREKQPTEVVVPDTGLRKEQIAFLLADKLGWSNEQIKKFAQEDTSPLGNMQEGYIAPGKYEIPAGATTYDVALMMRQRALEQDNAYKSVLKPADWDKALIIASIVQKEMKGHEEDRFEIAKQIWADLVANKPIKSDATIEYLRDTRAAYGESFCDGKTEAEAAQNPDCHQDWRLQFNVSDARKINWWAPATDADRADDWDLFNTYLHTGLPMRAISNPGIDALDAAVQSHFNPDGSVIK